MSVKITDHMPSFSRSVSKVMDDALKEGATDTLVGAKLRAPFQHGQLRSSTDAKRVGSLLWRVSFWMEYARFQEFGGDGKRRVRHYTTAGTGKGYLKQAGDTQAKKLNLAFAKHGMRARP